KIIEEFVQIQNFLRKMMLENYPTRVLGFSLIQLVEEKASWEKTNCNNDHDIYENFPCNLDWIVIKLCIFENFQGLKIGKNIYSINHIFELGLIHKIILHGNNLKQNFGRQITHVIYTITKEY